MRKFDTVEALQDTYQQFLAKEQSGLGHRLLLTTTAGGIEEIHQGVKVKPEEVAYIGEDLNDFGCMEYLYRANGTTGCPEDAVLAIQEVSTFISSKEGGKGAVREFIEFLTK